MNKNMFCFQCEQTFLFGLKGIAAYAYHAMVLGYSNAKVNDFFYEGLRAWVII